MRRPYSEAELAHLLADARARWPAIDLDGERFFRHLLDRAPDRAALAKVHAADLYLACACADGNRRALAHLEASFLAQVPAWVATTDRSRAFADEVAQELRHRLLVAGDDGPPRISQYVGRGPLGAWLRMAATRIALRLKSRDPAASVDDRSLAAPGPDPEMSYLKTRYARDFETAFEETLAALPTRERNVLRLHFLEEMTTSQIGAVLGVHGSTITRWLARIRSAIIKETNRRLRQRLKVEPSELRSILRLVQSRLDVSIRRALRSS